MRHYERNVPKEQVIEVAPFTSVRELGLLFEIPVDILLGKALELGMTASINQRLDETMIALFAEAVDVKVKITSLGVKSAKNEPSDGVVLSKRPPVVAIMGHVDHGKTSLLDYIRKSKMAEQEIGAITQRIGAYSIEVKSGDSIVFLDTPGHAAFTAMRALGAQVTDIIVLIVAADDGVMPQTKEAINHGQLANLPIIVAINKIDKDGADLERVMRELSECGLVVESWGGKQQCQAISAKSGEGVEQLLEKLLLEAELLELKANPNKAASGTIIESTLAKGRGYLATLIVEEGTLRQGDLVLAGSHYGRVKRLLTPEGRTSQFATPGMPVQLLGLSGSPQAGQSFQVITEEQEARRLVGKHNQIALAQRLRAEHGSIKQRLAAAVGVDKKATLSVLLKAGEEGILGALADELLKRNSTPVKLKIISQAVGPVTESDVLLASATSAIIIGFQTKSLPQARAAAAKHQVKIEHHAIIYRAIEAVEEATARLEALQKPVEKVIGKALIKKVFDISRIGKIAGCLVTEGKISRHEMIRILRDKEVRYQGKIKELKREKEIIEVAKMGSECGIYAQGFDTIEVGDIIESFSVENRSS